MASTIESGQGFGYPGSLADLDADYDPLLEPVRVFCDGRLEIDPYGDLIKVDGEKVEMSVRCAVVFLELTDSPNCVLSRDHIWQRTYGSDKRISVRAIDTAISDIRQALGPEIGAHIVTVKNEGYVFKTTLEDQTTPVEA